MYTVLGSSILSYISLENTDLIPWKTVCIDLLGPYTVNGRIINIMTCVDPATVRFGIDEINDKTSTRIS